MERSDPQCQALFQKQAATLFALDLKKRTKMVALGGGGDVELGGEEGEEGEGESRGGAQEG